MEFFAIVFGLLLLATVFMPWINHFRLLSAGEDIARLRKRIRALEDALAAKRGVPAVDAVVAEAQVVPETRVIVEEIEAEASGNIPAHGDFDVNILPEQEAAENPARQGKAALRTAAFSTGAAGRATKTGDGFEQDIATKLPVWIGAVSLIFAAFFLVKYSIELGWLSPLVRVCIGGAFGAGLLAAGQWIARRPGRDTGAWTRPGSIWSRFTRWRPRCFCSSGWPSNCRGRMCRWPLPGRLPPRRGFTAKSASGSLKRS